MTYEAVIGLEIHVQLKADSKLFCSDPIEFGGVPNSRVCPTCLGLPGALPVINRQAVHLAVRAALGLGCSVHPVNVFARKNYFYPDLPKGYQITQYDRPLATGGSLSFAEGPADPPKWTTRIRRIHLEEDAGKLLHDRLPGRTAIDLNRAGTPLVEIVTEPDIRAPVQARAFLTALVRVLTYLDVSDCNMEEGSLRVDANVSVRPEGSQRLGTKTELKNMNSFSAIEKALAAEIRRQSGLLVAGEKVRHETLLWETAHGRIRVMRSKEEAEDYRYFPDPDLPPLVLSRREIQAIGEDLPELPADKAARFRQEYQLPAYDAGVLTVSPALADYFEATAAACGDAKAASNWVMTDVLAWINQSEERCIGHISLSPAGLGRLIGLVADGTISHTVARKVFGRAVETGMMPEEIVEAEGLAQVRDQASLERWVDEVLKAYPEEVARIVAGEKKVFGFLMGQLMKRSAGKADPRQAAALLNDKLRGGSG